MWQNPEPTTVQPALPTGCFRLLLQGMIGKEPEDVAKFLQKTAGLDKAIVGEYLGEREDQALRVMHAYVRRPRLHRPRV